jgi:hypothetical protein
MTFETLAHKRKFLVSIFLFGMFCCNLTLFIRCIPSLRKGYQDFTIYYTSALLVRQGKAAALYDAAVQYQTQLAFATVPEPKASLPYNHPPFEALLFVPFTWMRYWYAYLFWTALNVFMVAASALLLRRFQRIRELSPLLLALACMGYFPIAIGMVLGQDVFLLLLLMVLALISLDRGRDEVAGVWLAIGLFRPHMILPLALLLAIRRWRLLIGFAPVALGLGIISALIAGWTWPLEFLRFVGRVEEIWRHDLGPQQAPNLRGLFGYLPGIRNFVPLTFVLIAISSLAVLVLAVRRIGKGNDSVSYLFCLAIVTTILVSFHALWYDFTFLLPMVLFMIASLMTSGPREIGAVRVALLFFLFLSPLYIYLAMEVHRFFWFSLPLLGLFALLLRMPEPAVDPA